MPRSQTRASRRTRQGKQSAATTREDSAERDSPEPVATESTPIGRNKRSTRNLSVIYSDSSRRVSGVTAERVTRSRTRASRNEPVEPTRAAVNSDDDDEEEVDDDDESYSETESSPRKKKARTSRRRSSPKKSAKTPNRAGRAGRKRKAPRRSRKQETEDEESEDSLNLSESEADVEQVNEEEEDEASAKEDHESQRVKSETVATPRRGNRSGTRSSSATPTTPATQNVSNKSSPSVVLLRMENTPANAARPVRGRGAAAKQKKDPAPKSSSDDITASEEVEGESAAARNTGSSSSRLRGRRSSARQSRPQQQRPSSASSRRGKMVPTEQENAAAVSTDTANKEEEEDAAGGGDNKGKEKSDGDEEPKPKQKQSEEVKEEEADVAAAKDAGKKQQQQEEEDDDDDDVDDDKQKDIPETKKEAEEDDDQQQDSTSAAAAADKQDDSTSDEKMEVDEPSATDAVAAASATAVASAANDDQPSETAETEEELKTDSGSSGKHKLELEGDSGSESGASVAKKPKVDEELVQPKEKEPVIIDLEDSKDSTSKVENASSEDKPGSPKPAEEKTSSEIVICDDNAVNGEKAAKEPEPSSDTPAVVEPKVNGSTTDDTSVMNSDTDNISRQLIANPDLSDNAGKDLFSVVSYNLAEEDWSAKHQSLVDEVLQLSPSILCLQEIDEGYFKRLLDSALKSHGYIGLYKAGKLANKGLATFYLLSSFEVLHHRELEVQELLEKDIQQANLLDEEKEALKSFLNSQAPVLITKLKSIANGKTITVGTVSLPSDNEVVLAVQVAAVMREILEISEGANNPHVLCSSFDLHEDSVVYQLLRDGLLKNEVVDDLKKKAKVPVLEKESAEISTLLETFFRHSSDNLKSSYGSILGHELTFPDKTQKLSKDSVWFSSNSLFTKNVLDVGRVGKQAPANNHVSLKVELGFMN